MVPQLLCKIIIQVDSGSTQLHMFLSRSISAGAAGCVWQQRVQFCCVTGLFPVCQGPGWFGLNRSNFVPGIILLRVIEISCAVS